MNPLLTVLASGDAEGLIWLVIIVISIIAQVIGGARKAIAGRPKPVAPPVQPKQAGGEAGDTGKEDGHSFLRHVPHRAPTPSGDPDPTIAKSRPPSDGAEELRRFLETITGAPAQTPRPVRVEAPPFVPPQRTAAHPPGAIQPSAPSARVPVVAVTPVPVQPVQPRYTAHESGGSATGRQSAGQARQWLTSRSTLRSLVLSYEVFGPPRARQAPGPATFIIPM
jgi:hypothetical protein